MPEGQLVRLNEDGGFGFIDSDDGDVFFRRSAVKGFAFEELTVGQSVVYELGRRSRSGRRHGGGDHRPEARVVRPG